MPGPGGGGGGITAYRTLVARDGVRGGRGRRDVDGQVGVRDCKLNILKGMEVDPFG